MCAGKSGLWLPHALGHRACRSATARGVSWPHAALPVHSPLAADADIWRFVGAFLVSAAPAVPGWRSENPGGLPYRLCQASWHPAAFAMMTGVLTEQAPLWPPLLLR